MFGELDRNAGASHVVGISHPAETAELILEAANVSSPV